MSIPRLSLTRALRAGLSAVVLASGGLVAGCGEEAPPVSQLSQAQVDEQLATAPPGLSQVAAQLEGQAGELIDGGPDPTKTLAATVRSLQGTPVVVNVWADWCAPCKKEMPIFQRVALAQRGKVVFFGAASRASKADSAAYLRKIAMPYPSLLDEDGKLIELTGVDGLPKTFFYDRSGKRYVHNGPYKTEAELLADIGRYAS